MEPEINYQSVPNGYAHCFNGQCAYADQCLRHLLAEHIPAERNFVTAVNPGKAASDGKSCPFFRPKKVMRLAFGMHRLYNNLNYQRALAIRHDINLSLGRGMYYRMRNGERAISPDEQRFIKTIFLKHGETSEPLFDDYKEEYEW